MFLFIAESKESNLAVLPEIKISCCSSTDRGNLSVCFLGPSSSFFPIYNVHHSILQLSASTSRPVISSVTKQIREATNYICKTYSCSIDQLLACCSSRIVIMMIECKMQLQSCCWRMQGIEWEWDAPRKERSRGSTPLHSH